MLLPHEIVATFLGNGETVRMTGQTVARLKHYMRSCLLVFHPGSSVMNLKDHAIPEGLSAFWEEEKNTRWFQNHPVLAEPCPYIYIYISR